MKYLLLFLLTGCGMAVNLPVVTTPNPNYTKPPRKVITTFNCTGVTDGSAGSTDPAYFGADITVSVVKYEDGNDWLFSATVCWGEFCKNKTQTVIPTMPDNFPMDGAPVVPFDSGDWKFGLYRSSKMLDVEFITTEDKNVFGESFDCEEL